MDMMAEALPDWNLHAGRPKSLSLQESVRMTLMRLRRNATFAELGEDFGLAASTAWGYFQEIATMLGELLAVDIDDLAESVKGKVCLVDGTLVTVFNWRHRNDLFSGKHRQYGMNVQVVADLHGRVLGVSRGFPGSWHDMHCLTDAGLTTLAGAAGTAIGDSGYQGSDMTTPNKKQPGQDRTESGLKHNPAIAVIRVRRRMGQRAPRKLANPRHPLPRQPHPIQPHHHRHRRTHHAQRTTRRTSPHIQKTQQTKSFRITS